MVGGLGDVFKGTKDDLESFNKGFTGAFNETAQVIKDDLKVFDRENPIPAKTLNGNKAVMKYLKLD